MCVCVCRWQHIKVVGLQLFVANQFVVYVTVLFLLTMFCCCCCFCCFCLLCLAGQPSMAGLCSQSSASSQDICFVAIPSDANEVDVIVEVGWLLVRCCCPFMFQFYMFIPIFLFLLLLLQLLFCGLSTLYYVDVLSI